MLKEALLSLVNAILYLFTRRHILEGRYDQKKRRYRNWDGSYQRSPRWYELPETEAELAALVRGAQRVSCVDAGHSFNDLHLNDEVMISLDRYQGLVSHDPEARTATFRAGTRMRTRCNDNTMIGPGSGDPDQELMWMAPHLVGAMTREADEAIWRRIIEDVDGRPHYGKNMVGLPPSYVVAHQPEWNDFLRVVEKMDPEHKFTNDLVRATLETP